MRRVNTITFLQVVEKFSFLIRLSGRMLNLSFHSNAFLEITNGKLYGVVIYR